MDFCIAVGYEQDGRGATQMISSCFEPKECSILIDSSLFFQGFEGVLAGRHRDLLRRVRRDAGAAG